MHTHHCQCHLHVSCCITAMMQPSLIAMQPTHHHGIHMCTCHCHHHPPISCHITAMMQPSPFSRPTKYHYPTPSIHGVPGPHPHLLVCTHAPMSTLTPTLQASFSCSHPHPLSAPTHISCPSPSTVPHLQPPLTSFTPQENYIVHSKFIMPF